METIVTGLLTAVLLTAAVCTAGVVVWLLINGRLKGRSIVLLSVLACIVLVVGILTVPSIFQPISRKPLENTEKPQSDAVVSTEVSEGTVYHLPEPENDDFVSVKAYIPDISVELRYATNENFTGQTIYSFDDVYLRYGTVKKLVHANAVLKKEGYGLKIWDGFRPVSAQFTLWNAYPDGNFVADPNRTYSSHSRGNTVDLTLVRLNGEPVEMPTDFDDFSSRADRDYADCTQEAARNAMILESAMMDCGFEGYQMEWWHYADADEYPVEEVFDPALISRWVVECDSFVYMFASPDASSEMLIPISHGETVTVMGYTGNYALGSYENRQGYVEAGYLVPED